MPFKPDRPLDYRTFTEAAELALVNDITIWRWVNAGLLPVSKFGDRRFIREADLWAFLERHEFGRKKPLAKYLPELVDRQAQAILGRPMLREPVS